VLLSAAAVDEEFIEAAISSLAAAGIEASVTEEQPIDVLSTVPGLDAVALSSVSEEATAAAAALSQAEAAEVAADAAEADAATAEVAATALEAEATSLENDVVELETRLNVADEPIVSSDPALEASPEESSSAMMTVVAALVAAGIIAPGTIFSIMAMFFKPLLRRKLLRLGWRRLADLVVPDVKSDVKAMSVKMNELEAFMSKQKLPRLLDITPDIVASEIELD
jgi:nucleoid-associated protein YgaU